MCVSLYLGLCLSMGECTESEFVYIFKHFLRVRSDPAIQFISSVFQISSVLDDLLVMGAVWREFLFFVEKVFKLGGNVLECS